MDYFLFNFSGVQFHYTMSHYENILLNMKILFVNMLAVYCFSAIIKK